MAEGTANAGNTAGTEGKAAQAAGTEGAGFAPITTQEELDRLMGQRVLRERSKYSDYEDLKAKAAKFDEVEQANKTELQKAQDALAEANGKLKSFEQQEQIAAWALEASKKTGVPVEVLRGTTQAEITAHAELIKPVMAGGYPIIKSDGGEKAPPAPTKDSILAIEDERERKAAIAANLNLF